MLSSLLLRYRGRACPERAYESIRACTNVCASWEWNLIIGARTHSGTDVPGSAGFVFLLLEGVVASGLQPVFQAVKICFHRCLFKLIVLNVCVEINLHEKKYAPIDTELVKLLHEFEFQASDGKFSHECSQFQELLQTVQVTSSSF